MPEIQNFHRVKVIIINHDPISFKGETQYNYIFGYLPFLPPPKRKTSEMRLGFIIHQPDVQHLIIFPYSTNPLWAHFSIFILIMGPFSLRNYSDRKCFLCLTTVADWLGLTYPPWIIISGETNSKEIQILIKSFILKLYKEYIFMKVINYWPHFQHLDGWPMQFAPYSIWHVVEHPSPFLLFPSSHCSYRVIIPFPQIDLQNEGVPWHW